MLHCASDDSLQAQKMLCVDVRASNAMQTLLLPMQQGSSTQAAFQGSSIASCPSLGLLGPSIIAWHSSNACLVNTDLLHGVNEVHLQVL